MRDELSLSLEDVFRALCVMLGDEYIKNDLVELECFLPDKGIAITVNVHEV